VLGIYCFRRDSAFIHDNLIKLSDTVEGLKCGHEALRHECKRSKENEINMRERHGWLSSEMLEVWFKNVKTL